MVVFALGKNLLFKSLLGHCGWPSCSSNWGSNKTATNGSEYDMLDRPDCTYIYCFAFLWSLIRILNVKTNSNAYQKDWSLKL